MPSSQRRQSTGIWRWNDITVMNAQWMSWMCSGSAAYQLNVSSGKKLILCRCDSQARAKPAYAAFSYSDARHSPNISMENPRGRGESATIIPPSHHASCRHRRWCTTPASLSSSLSSANVSLVADTPSSLHYPFHFVPRSLHQLSSQTQSTTLP